MAEFQTESGSIYYEVLDASGATASQAQTVTLLHNFMSSGRTAWRPYLDQLTERYRVLLPDMPGHGRSLGHPPGFKHFEMARQLGELMVQERAEVGHLIGCSAGGMVAQSMVHHELIEPASLALISTTYSKNPATTGNTLELSPERFLFGNRWMEATAKLHDPHQGDGYFDAVLLPGFRELDAERSTDLSLDALKTWQMPVCLIHGEEDEFFPPFIPQAMAHALPNAELHLIPEQSHALLFRQPWKVGEILVDFLKRVSAVG